MGFDNPIIPWRELERRLSDRKAKRAAPPREGDAATNVQSLPHQDFENHLGDSAASDGCHVPYAELHSHSRFSFMFGSSAPEQLVAETSRLGLTALALTDRDGFYGSVRFAEAAKEFDQATVFGSELTLDLPHSPKRSRSLPVSQRRDSSHSLVVLARNPEGYATLGTLISEAHMAGRKGEPQLSTQSFLEAAAETRDCWAILTGAHGAAIPSALVEHGPQAAGAVLDPLVEAAGKSNVFMELWDHGDPIDTHRNDALAEIAVRRGVQPLCTNAVRYATPVGRRLSDALVALGDRKNLEAHSGWLAAWNGAHLRSGAEQARRFARYPGAVGAAANLGTECAFNLSLVAPELPPYPCPDGLDEISYLRQLVREGGALARYGSRNTERVPGAWQQIDHELEMINRLGFPGYFLVVWDIASFCKTNDIYCQGRGSAANSAVCYVLGITNVDSVALGLLFERFLSPERDGPPDIDIDIESGRREEVIQYVYERYGRDRTALVVNVITYRGRSAIRDMAKALGHPKSQQDIWAKSLDRYGGLHKLLQTPQDTQDSDNTAGSTTRESPSGTSKSIPVDVLSLAAQAEGGPRHLGIHSGGMVICDRPIAEVCPVEWASMANRSVLQ